MSENIEEWRDVVGYEGRYQVSNIGGVRSIAGAVRGGGNTLSGSSSGRYLRVVLYDTAGKPHHKSVHVLVACAFIGPAPHLHEINHKDGNGFNPTLENLEYVTRSENAIHAFRVIKTRASGDRHHFRTNPDCVPRGDRHGTVTCPESIMRGEMQSAAKLTDQKVIEMRARYASGEGSTVSLAREYGVSQGTAWKVLNRLSWKHI